MVNAKATNNKKRSATTKIQAKPAKALKTSNPEEGIEQDQEQEDQSEGLFDNLDEEMDPSTMDDIINQLEGNSQSEEEDSDDESENIGEEEEEDQEEVEEEEEEEQEAEEEEDDKMEEDEKVPASSEQQSTAKRFRDSYMTKVTQAFGSDLDIIRQEPNLSGPRLNILIDSLEAGIDIFSTLEQEIILADEEK